MQNCTCHRNSIEQHCHVQQHQHHHEPQQHHQHRHELQKYYGAVVGYCRESTKRQLDSLKSQETIIKAFCKTNKLLNSLVIRSEIHSAFRDNDLKRPVFKCMITNIPDYSLIIVSDVSRFSRNYENAIQVIDNLMKKKVNVISVIDRCDTDSDYTQFVELLKASMEDSQLKSKKLTLYHRAKNYSINSDIIQLLNDGKYLELREKYSKKILTKYLVSDTVLEYIFQKHKNLIMTRLFHISLCSIGKYNRCIGYPRNGAYVRIFEFYTTITDEGTFKIHTALYKYIRKKLNT